MKKYIVPEIEIASFELTDVLTVSGEPVVNVQVANPEDGGFQYAGFEQ